MSALEIPHELKSLLQNEHLAPLLALAGQVETILVDNKLPFFPDYTDHGISHIQSLLKTQVELIPDEVWNEREKHQTLSSEDIVLIVGGSLLHDIAMHIQPVGFLEVIEGKRFTPLPWFCNDNCEYTADKTWPDEWSDYVRKASRFSEKMLIKIVGYDCVRSGWSFTGLPKDVNQWKRPHFLVVGEFLRRHHARIAHEIAIFGFPGIEDGSRIDQFPALATPGHSLCDLADLIGLSARSHNMSLRVAQSYLNETPKYKGSPRPFSTAALYPMALLRVGDYLQIDHKRAPAVLLQLHEPQSSESIKAWKTHASVRSVDSHYDPSGVKITVADDIPLSIFLQLEILLSGLQAEMDHSTAVLSESYGRHQDQGLHTLQLSKRRVYSNIHEPAYKEALPYIPEKSGFSADPNILTLLVEPLYGKYPGVAVREAIQNGVDAVMELKIWADARDISLDSLKLPDQIDDVVVEFELKYHRLEAGGFVSFVSFGMNSFTHEGVI